MRVKLAKNRSLYSCVRDEGGGDHVFIENSLPFK